MTDLYGVEMMRGNGRYWLREFVYRTRDEAEQAAINVGVNNATDTRVHVFKPNHKRYATALEIVNQKG